MQELKKKEQYYSFKNYFIPLTTTKAIHWIIVIGLVVYTNMLFNGFVWDDFVFIISPVDIHTFNLIHLLFGINKFNSVDYYRPVPAAYFSLLYNLFGTHAFFYHFIQLILHILNACLLYLFLKKFFHNALSFCLALIFLIHPIQVESVSFIGASQSELFFLFGISSLLISMKKELHFLHVLLVSILLFLSIMTKETGFLFLIMVILIQILFNRKRTFLFLPYVFSITVIYLFIRFFVVHVYLAKDLASAIGRFPLLTRLMNIPAIVFYYIKTFFYPAALGIDQQWAVTSFDFNHFYFPLLIDLLFILFITFLGIYIYKHRRKSFDIFLFFLLWFLFGLSMLLQIFPLDMTVSDRWFYFPIVGLLGIIGVGIQSVKNLQVKHGKICFVVFIVIVILLSVRTIVRSANWTDSLTLYNHDISVDDNYDLENNLGGQLGLERHFSAALPHLKKSVEFYPFDTNLYNFGSDYEYLHEYKLAEIYYKKAISAKGDQSSVESAYLYLLDMMLPNDKPENSLLIAEEAVKKFPNEWRFRLYLAQAQYSLHQQNAAFLSAEKAKELNSNVMTIKIYTVIANKRPLFLRTQFNE